MISAFAAAIVALFSLTMSSPAGDAEQGQEAFKRLRCDSCHSVPGGEDRARHPLPDLTNQPADEVAAKIRQHGQLTPETTIDDVLMSCAVSQMTEDELRQIVAWLRTLRPR